jgi:hypothetical protein
VAIGVGLDHRHDRDAGPDQALHLPVVRYERVEVDACDRADQGLHTRAIPSVYKVVKEPARR